jgi:four helix bundle protein
MTNIRHFRDLEVYQLAMAAAMKLFEASKKFPLEERYSLTDQMRRSSRSVSANISEAWRKRRYPNAFVSKLSDAEAEAAETQVWIEFSVKCGYFPSDQADELDGQYENIQGKLVNMLSHPEQWRIH